MTCRSAINQAAPGALPERLARAYCGCVRCVGHAESSPFCSAFSMAAAIRAALDEAAKVARETRALEGPCRLPHPSGACEHDDYEMMQGTIAAAIEALKG